MGFVKSAAKKSLLALTKKGELTPRFWARFFEAFVTKDELVNYANGGSGGTGTGSIHHGSLTGLTDDDHSKYLLASDATSRTAFATNWLDLTDSGDTTIHGHDVTGLTNWPTINYSYVSGNDAATNVAATELEELSDGSDTILHVHDSLYYLKSESASIITVLLSGEDSSCVMYLPSANTCEGTIYNLKAINIDNPVSVATVTDDELIDSYWKTSIPMSLYLMESVTVQSDGSNWWII